MWIKGTAKLHAEFFGILVNLDFIEDIYISKEYKKGMTTVVEGYQIRATNAFVGGKIYCLAEFKTEKEAKEFINNLYEEMKTNVNRSNRP